MKRLRAAVVGLGRVGLRFDEEPGRKVIWTHVGAYQALPKEYELIAGCDQSAEARSGLAARCPDARLFDDVKAMMREADPDVVSICTPADSHASVLPAVLAGGSLRAIWCEKPLAMSVEEGERVRDAASGHRVPVFVSHVRRWTPLWQAARQHVHDGRLGAIRCIRIAMGNRLWTIGSHAVDLALFLGGAFTEVRTLDVPALREDDEPARAALVLYASGAYGIIQVTGLKKVLVVEAEILGDAGRMTVREDRGEIAIELFETSRRYSGYVEPSGVSVELHGTPSTESPFVEIARDIAQGAPPRCSAEDAVMGLRMLEQIAGGAAR